MTTTVTAPAASGDDARRRLTELADKCGFVMTDLYDDVHGTASRIASDTNNNGIGAQVAFLIDHLGERATEKAITEQAYAKLDDALGVLVSLIPALRTHLHTSGEPSTWQRSVKDFGAALAEMYRVLAAITTEYPRLEQPLLLPHALLDAMTAYDTDRVREQYIDRARLLAGLAKYQALAASSGAPVADPIAVDPEDDSKYVVLFLELPAEEDGFGDLGPDRQFTRHMKRSDLERLLPWLPLVPAGDPAAPRWDGHSKSVSNQRMQRWSATPVTGSDPTMLQETPDER
ncbi:hypothetical protein [Nocardia asiatica]|uniref:hypothetical protein n=1 Tax=Nocardia asiatica TaxID=209252 RepID=UPI00030848E9|nr:hypothetical protein [Nocardia asiatica]